MKYLTILALLLGLIACDGPESGAPPVFTEFIATAVSFDQITLTWSPATDDLLDASELLYGIWVAPEGTGIDPDAAPTYKTGEGAVSYTLTGLEAATTYQILVRAGERGSSPQWSETTAKTKATLQQGAGRYMQAATYDLSDLPRQLISGRVFSADRDSLGLVYDRRISWIDSDTNGALTSSGQEDYSETILEAHLVKVRNVDVADLFLLTSSGLFYSKNDENNAGTFGNLINMNFNPKPGTLSFLNDETEGPLVVFVETSGTNRITSFKRDGSSGPRLESKGTFGSNTNTIAIRLANLDSDEFYDAILFNSSGLKVYQDNGKNFEFQTTAKEAGLVSGAQTSQADFSVSFFATPSNSRDLAQVQVFLRDASGDRTRMWLYNKDSSDNFFADGTVVDYGSAAFDKPLIGQHEENGAYNLLVAQTSSNNIGIFENLKSTSATQFYGVEGTPELIHLANLDGLNSRDLLVVSNGSQRKLTFLPDNR